MFMKKFFTLLAMMSMLTFSSQAAYYLVGQQPFGQGWDPSTGVELTLNSEGLYSYKATINGAIYFVLADNLASPGDWDTFNNDYRIGPLGANETVGVNEWITTQKAQGNGSGSYMFIGTGSEYTITYNPYISKFKIEGDQGEIEIDSYTVAGTPAAVFGTEWDPANTDNDMIKQEDGTYALTKYGCELAGSELAFKVVANHSWDSGFAWPNQDYVFSVEEPGVYDVTIKFNPESEEVSVEAVQSGSIDVLTGDLFILGQVNGNGWDPSVGYKMDTENGKVFTGTITTEGESIDEEDGIGYSYFSFTTKLSESSEDWSSIGAYRIGATEDGFPLTEDLMGVELGLSNFGQTNSFKIAAGEYDLTVDVENKIMIINKAETPEPPAGPTLEKVWEITDLSFMPTADVRQGFGMGGKFYINCKTYTTDSVGNVLETPTLYVVDENGADGAYAGGRNCGITRDEAGNIVISNAIFPTAWSEATIEVFNPETGISKEYTVPEQCGIDGRSDMLGFAKGDLMADGVLYLASGTTNGVGILTINGSDVNLDESYLATCDGLSPTTSTVVNYYKDLDGEDALLYVTRNAAPLKLVADGENFTATPIVLPFKAPSNGAFPFIWDGKEYFLYPAKTAEEANYLDGFAIAEADAEEPLVYVPSTVAAAANGYQCNWLNAEVDKDGVTIYQYYPGSHLTVYRLTNGTGGVEELINDVEKVVSSVRYYNIMGQEVQEINGLTIVVTTYTDGTRSAVKVIK